MTSSRSKPFSGKKKKQQMQEKRSKKREEEESKKVIIKGQVQDTNVDINVNIDPDANENTSAPANPTSTSNTISKAPNSRRDLRTIFEKESKVEIDQRKEDAHRPLNLEKRDKPWSILSEYLTTTPIDMPKRPKWSFDATPSEIEKLEQDSFRKWLDRIYNNYPSNRLNYFEHNLEVWRQLWRVCERSDIVMLITDARFPLFHFPPSLYDFLVKDLKKPIILVFNKQDLVDSKTITAWHDYFEQNYPHLTQVAFNSFTIIDPNQVQDVDKKRKLRRQKRYETSKGMEQLFEAINSLKIVKDRSVVTVTPPVRAKSFEDIDSDSDSDDNSDDNRDDEIESGSEDEDVDDKEETEDGVSEDDDDHEEKSKNPRQRHSQEDVNEKHEGIITIGTVGHPNVGKSSLINGLMGRKVVSTSRTPGHTKHFQTIFLTKQVVLCDCPGLVFPALDRPKALQILCGLFPIAQVREPYSAIRYLAERIPIEKVYGLKYPKDDPDDKEEKVSWSPYKLCEGFAYKKGYLIARTGRADVHRAGLELLKDCLDGRISISWPPPGLDEAALKAIEDKKKEEEENKKEEESKNEEGVEDHEEGNKEDGDESDLSEEEDEAPKIDKKLKKKLKKQQQLAKILDEDDELDEELRAAIKLAKKQNKIKEKEKQKTATTTTTESGPSQFKKGKAYKKKTSKAAEWQDRLEAKQKRL